MAWKIGAPYKFGRDLVAKAGSMAANYYLHIPKFFNWFIEKPIKWTLDIIAKPLYDWCERKGLTWGGKIKMDKATEELKDAKTKTDIDNAIDNVP
jgi:hypothetical protein